ncbi:hypothetical protein ACQPYA_27850 [Micromonospora sp. CA-263727]|uniref:hypothetical protein n=1 Tax=Micromonospora sp. CA-263727 TaxID=3239967 RepID=UPI003D8DB6EA
MRAEPTRPYEPVRAERPRPYDATPPENRPGPAYDPPVEPGPVDHPSWAAGPTSAPSGEERPSWAARSASGPPADERPAWASRPVSGAPGDEGLPWGARTEEGVPWGSRAASQPPADERLPWALRPASAPPASAPPFTPPPASGPPYPPPSPASAPPVVPPPAAAPPPATSPAAAPPAGGSVAGREALPESGPASPVAQAGASDVPAHRPFRLRPVPSEPTPGPPAPAPAPPGPSTAPAASDPLTGPAGAVPGYRERIPTAPAPTSAAPYAARRSAPEPAEPAGDRSPDSTSAVLPQRVPAEPDVPVVPEPPAVEPPAETPELARIATHLRRDDEPAPLRERPEGFDVNAILDAVRGVDGVRDAALRRTPAGAHSLRLDLADGADPAEVSRQVARLLQERMGLAAAPHGVPALPAALVRRRLAEARGGDADESRPSAEPRRPGTRPAGARAEAGTARAEPAPDTLRRRRPAPVPHRGRATVEETGPPGSPATLGASYSGGQLTTTESAPSRPINTDGAPGPRVVLDHVQVSTFGLDATVEVRLIAGEQSAAGYATGPAVDGYVLRLCAVAAAAAVDELLAGASTTADRGRCFVEHAAVVPFGNCEVATVVVLLVCDGWVEQLAGSALVAGDPRQAVVRASLAAVNRRLEALLA